MSSKARISLMQSGVLPSTAREGASAGQRLRDFIKFALAASAVGSAAYGAYQALHQPERGARVAETRREPSPGARKSFFQALIEADRAVLKDHTAASAAPAFRGWQGFEPPAVAAGGQAIDRDDREKLRNSLRGFFTMGDPQVNPHNAGREWELAFFESAIVRRPPSAQQPVAAPAPAPAPAPQPEAVRPPPVAPAVIAELRRSGVGSPVEKPAARPTGGFREVHAAPLKPPVAAPRDDVDFVNAVVATAEKDFTYLARAQAVMAEFIRRHPQAAESAQLRTQQTALQNRHAAALAERTTLTQDTNIAPVLFAPAARQAIVGCLSEIGDLQKLSAVNRPVSLGRERLAFLVAATIRLDSAPHERDHRLEAARQRIAPALGACLAPLFEKGTVALAVTDGQDADVTRQRIDGEPNAVVFSRDASEALP